MAIDYDEDFTKVMTELKTNFGWSNIEVLPDSYRDLLNDTIKAVKNCSIPENVVRSEQLCPKCKVPMKPLYDKMACFKCMTHTP